VSLRVGLTGGIGSGKSTVAAWLAKQGAHLVDTDAIARQLTQAGGAALPQIAATFGADTLDAAGALDRGRMRQVVFADPLARQTLERIIHPLVSQEAETQASLATAEQPVVFDIPLLAESTHWRERLDKILVVDCLCSTQVQRVQARSGWELTQIRQVIAQQANRPHRRSIADAIVYNEGGSIDSILKAINKLWIAGFFTRLGSDPCETM
jgi:dephospho-CoA kinase